MKFSDDILMAYADGELDASVRAEIEAAMDEDPAIAEAIDRHMQLRERLRGAFDTAFDGEIPERLIDAAHTAPAATIPAPAPLPATVTPIDSARPTPPRRRWSWPEWAAMAASLLIGVLIARMPWDKEQSIAAQAGRMTAGGDLAAALDQQLSGARIEGSDVHIGLTYRSKTGELCRTFVMTETTGVSGVACRETDAWHVVAVASTEPTANVDRYRMAGTTVAPLILQVVQDSIDGSALNSAAETRARERGWK